MKSFSQTGRWSLLGLCLLISTLAGNAQNAVTLNIGDKVPEFKFAKWLKGEKVSDFTGDRLYVLEFWATWCGPCIAAMPHLTKLQEEYKDKATFIGVDVWERPEEGQAYGSTIHAVEKFVNGNTVNMGYAVAVDNGDQHMGNNWLKAAGEIGIPSTFIVKNNTILWIGHPGKLDSTLPVILNGSYDMMAYRAKRDQSNKAGLEMVAEMQTLFLPIQNAMKDKDFARAVEFIDKGIAEKPKYKATLQSMKLSSLLDSDPSRAINYAKELSRESKQQASVILSAVGQRKTLPKEMYLWAAKNYEENAQPTNPVVIHMLASVYAKAGEYKTALNWEEKAVESAKKAVAEKSMNGSVTVETVTAYEKALAEYRSKN